MDKKLTWDAEKVITVENSLAEVEANLPDYDFFVWEEIPEGYKESFFANESIINPVVETYDIWHAKLTRRPTPLFSVAISEGTVVASLSSGAFGEGRMVNLWHSNENHRGAGVGKAVFLKMLNYINENDLGEVVAWDVTTAQVGAFLTNYGFE